MAVDDYGMHVAAFADLIRHHGIRVSTCPPHHLSRLVCHLKLEDGPAAAFLCHDGMSVNVMRLVGAPVAYRLIARTTLEEIERLTDRDGIFRIWAIAEKARPA